jgi:hypothetical protein
MTFLQERQRLKIPSYGVNALLVLLAAFGMALRLRQYLFNRSLWGDEAALASNLIEGDVASLMTAPLSYHQSAAPGFLMAARSAVVAFGADEYAVRLVPLLAGLLVVVLAVILARRELKSAPAQVAFVGLVALSPLLIYYASEVKQYSPDAFFALAILVGVSYRTSRYGTWLLAAAGFFALAFSLPAIFVAVPASLLLLYEAIATSRWRQTVIVGIAWSLGAALHGAYLVQAIVDRAFMVKWWGVRDSFPPFPPTSIGKLLWYPHSFSNLTFLSFREVDHASPGFEEAWVDPLGVLLALALAAALFAVIRSRHRTGIVAAGAILTTFVASMFEIYPFSSRLLIFLVPLTLFVIAVGIDELDRRSAFAAAAAAVLMLSVVAPTAVHGAIEPRAESDMRGAVMELSRRFETGDAVAVIPSGLFQYYRALLRVDNLPILGLRKTTEARAVIEFAEQNQSRRLWIVAASHRYQADKLIRRLAATAPIVDEWRSHRTRLVLFDFSRR